MTMLTRSDEGTNEIGPQGRREEGPRWKMVKQVRLGVMAVVLWVGHRRPGRVVLMAGGGKGGTVAASDAILIRSW